MRPGPLDLESRDIFRLDSRLGLVAGIVQIAPPAIPLLTVEADRPGMILAKILL